MKNFIKSNEVRRLHRGFAGNPLTYEKKGIFKAKHSLNNLFFVPCQVYVKTFLGR